MGAEPIERLGTYLEVYPFFPDDDFIPPCAGNWSAFDVEGDLENNGAYDVTQSNQAKAICRECPVRAGCLEYALERPWMTGIWGGMGTYERKRMRKKMPVGTYQSNPPREQWQNSYDWVKGERIKDEKRQNYLIWERDVLRQKAAEYGATSHLVTKGRKVERSTS